MAVLFQSRTTIPSQDVLLSGIWITTTVLEVEEDAFT